ncbi:MGS207 protein [Halenospora varia]|nr:MGS207 protein [Halenospora varia]
MISFKTSSQQTGLSTVPTHDLGKLSDLPSQTLHRLPQENHASLALLHAPNLMFHSHMPHVLGSSCLLGASSSKLEEIYNHEAETLNPINSQFILGGVTQQNWRDFLARKEYTVAFTNFFDEEVAKNHGNWKEVLKKYLFAGEEPLINGFSGGLGHPFIHLAYAYEFQSKEVATEALSLGCTEYDPTHRYLDRNPANNSTYSSTSLADIITSIHKDQRFGGYFEQPGYTNIANILSKQEGAILEHWNSWIVDDPAKKLENCLDLAALLATCTNSAEQYDLFLAHVLTVGHALRVLLPYFSLEQQVTVMRQYGLFMILVYIAQLRPPFSKAEMESVNLKGRDWGWVSQKALTATWSIDSHCAKVIRALKVSAETWGEKDDVYCKAAVQFVTEFNNWTGFGLGVE